MYRAIVAIAINPVSDTKVFIYYMIGGGVNCLPGFYSPSNREVKLISCLLSMEIMDTEDRMYSNSLHLEMGTDFNRTLQLLRGVVEQMKLRGSSYPTDFARALLKLSFSEVEFSIGSNSVPIQQLLEL